MKKSIILLLSVLIYKVSHSQTQHKATDSCDQFSYSEKSRVALLTYIDHPCPNDETCKQEIAKAKREVDAGKIKLLIPLGLGTFEPRQKQQLKRLCDSLRLIYGYEMFSCVVDPGQTYGCYGLYMDKILATKFGDHFKDALIAKADTLFVETNPIVNFRDCDTLPRLKNTNEVLTDVYLTIDKNLLSQLQKCSYGDHPQVDIDFNIDTLGHTSGYNVSQFNECGKSDFKYKKQLTMLAVNYLKTFKGWIPGIILNRKVRTRYTTRVHFE